MEFFNANSLSELKTYGNFRDLKEKTKAILGENIKIKAKSWVELFESIQDIRKVTNLIKIESFSKEDLFFKGNTEKLIFYLVELDGKTRLDKLGITLLHYTNKKIAKKWKNSVSKQIHPDVCNNPLASDAMNELINIYEEMVR